MYDALGSCPCRTGREYYSTIEYSSCKSKAYLADSIEADINVWIRHLWGISQLLQNSCPSMDPQQVPTHHVLPVYKLSNFLWGSFCSMFKRVTTRSPTLPARIISEKAAEIPLSPIDMLMPRMHVPKLLYFASTAEPATVISNLLAALELTLKDIPMIAGTVALSKREADQNGSLSVQGPYFKAEDILSTNDLRHEYDYEQLRAAHFPSDGIAFEAIAPKPFGKAADSTPVMIAQVNFLREGLLLFFAVHHCVVDEVGLFNVMRVWSSYCRGGGDLNLVTPQWFDRTPLSQGAGTGRLQDHPEYTLTPEGTIARAAEDPGAFYPSSENAHSAIFFFSDEALERLRVAATMPGTTDEDGGNSWISTNDALTALLWCCITSARVADSTRETSEIFPLFVMAVNGRTKLRPQISPDYCGSVVLIAKTLVKAEDLLTQQPGRLAKVAGLIRKAVNVVDDAYARDVIQMVREVDDVGRLAPRRRPVIDYSVGCSTWAKQPYYSLDWGSTVGGACDRVRWRRFKTDGLFLIYPRMPNVEGLKGVSDARQGGIEVQLGLRSDHHQRLMEDPVFTEFGQWRCSESV